MAIDFQASADQDVGCAVLESGDWYFDSEGQDCKVGWPLIVTFLSQSLTPVVRSFETLVIFLREKSTIAIAKACLQRIHLLSTFRHGSPDHALEPDNVNIRVFLAAFMIAFRPTHVFESMGSREQTLFDAALP